MPDEQDGLSMVSTGNLSKRVPQAFEALLTRLTLRPEGSVQLPSLEPLVPHSVVGGKGFRVAGGPPALRLRTP